MEWKNKISSFLLIGSFCLGISLMGYPFFSDWWNSFHQSQAISDYSYEVLRMDLEKQKKLYQEAKDYNENLMKSGYGCALSGKVEKQYENTLNINGSGIMAYLEIPKIEIRLPVYHGTEEAVLQTAVGHMKGTSFPVEGRTVHSVLSGHRGLPSARLFSSLDRLEAGDCFFISVLQKTLVYEVSDIYVVLPEETETLRLEKDRNLCTLVTCTPYGVNTHRLLVRGSLVGESVEKPEKEVGNVEGNTVKREWLWILGFVFLTVLFVTVLCITVKAAKSSQGESGLKIIFEPGENSFSLYRIAEITEEGKYLEAEGFEGVLADLESVKDEELWFATEQLKEYVTFQKIKAAYEGKTDKKGELCLENIKPGWYLLLGKEKELDGYKITLMPSLCKVKEGEEEKTICVKYETELIPEDEALPKTGQIWWPLFVLIPLGIFLLILGKRGMR